MARGGHRFVRATRLEAIQFLQYLGAFERLNTYPTGLLLDRDSPQWQAKEADRLATMVQIGGLVHARLMRGSKSRSLSALALDPRPLRFELPLPVLKYISGMVVRRRGLFGATIEDHKSEQWKQYPGAWLFADKCRRALQARRGRPALDSSAIEKRLNDSAKYSERYLYRLLARSNKAIRLTEAGFLAGLLANVESDRILFSD